MTRPEQDVLTPQRFPVAKEMFAFALGQWAAMQPFTDEERKKTAENWNRAATGVDQLIDAKCSGLSDALRKSIKEAVSTKLHRKPEQFGVYTKIGVWKGNALTADQAAALSVPELSSIAFFASEAQKNLEKVKQYPQLLPNVEKQVVSTLAAMFASAFESALTKAHLDTVERFTGYQEPPPELAAKWKAIQQELFDEAKKQQEKQNATPAKQPASAG